MESKQHCGIKDNKIEDSSKIVLPQQNQCCVSSEHYFEHISLKTEDFTEICDDKLPLAHIKEEIEVPELKYSEIIIDESKEKVIAKHEQLKREQNAVIESKKYTPTCWTCEKKFSKDNELNEHYMDNEDHKPKRYLCTYCRKSFDYLTDLHNHKLELHAKKRSKRAMLQNTFMCKFCEKGFSRLSALETHAIYTHSIDKRFSCEHCGKSFITHKGLSRHRSFSGHRNREHEVEEATSKFIDKKEFKCNICQQIYQTEAGLRLHILKHVQEHDFLCKFCGQIFLSKSSLEAHIRSHRSNKSHKCLLCEKYFSTKSYLKRHKCARLNEGDIFKMQRKKYTCDFCKRKFVERNAFDRHRTECDPEPIVIN